MLGRLSKSLSYGPCGASYVFCVGLWGIFTRLTSTDHPSRLEYLPRLLLQYMILWLSKECRNVELEILQAPAVDRGRLN